MAPAPDKTEASWGEWGRFTITAVASSMLTLLGASFWLGGSVSELHAATEGVKTLDERADKLTEIGQGMKDILTRLTVITEHHNDEIKALKAKVFGEPR